MEELPRETLSVVSPGNASSSDSSVTCTDGGCPPKRDFTSSPPTRTSVIRRVPFAEASTSSKLSSGNPTLEDFKQSSASSSSGIQFDSFSFEDIKQDVVEKTDGAEESKGRKRGVGSRLELPLREKIKVIKARDSGKTMRQIATEFGCGKTQILNILSRRERYEKEWEVVCKVGGVGGGADRKRAARRTGNEETNRRVYHWWKEAEANGIRVTGPLLQSTARTIARKLGFENFAASNGWLASFRKTHGVQLKHDLAMNRHMGYSGNHLEGGSDLRVPKIEGVPTNPDRPASFDAHDTIDSKNLVEVLMDDDPMTVSPFKSEVPSSKSPSLDSVPEEAPSLLIFVKCHAQGYRLISLVYPDEEDNWWLEIRQRSACYAVPHFGYRSHLSRLIISQDLGFWLEVLGDCVQWGSLCNQNGDLDLSKLDDILHSLQSDLVCAGSGDVNVKSREPQQVRLASADHQSVGAFISRPDFRFRSFNCARLLPRTQSVIVCGPCKTLPPETNSWKTEPRSDEPPPPEHLHPKKRMRISYSDGAGSSSQVSPGVGVSPSAELVLDRERTPSVITPFESTSSKDYY